ncbi:MAG: hypothetical protein KW806_02560 [Candidatus Yanofskybacteria bacterium]|nr:hypothetical protein [Candidatus Yanofskybacteria bacterium]
MEDNLLLRLSEDQRLTRFFKVAHVLQQIAIKQTDLLRAYEKNNKDSLHPGFLYFINTVEGFWENFDFIISLGKRRERVMAHYPARSMLETLFRVEHYINHKKEGQNYIADVEILRIWKRLYDEGLSKQTDIQRVKDSYNAVLENAALDKDPLFLIDTVKERQLDPFPSLEQLTQQSRLSQAKDWYFHYRILCEHSHAKLVASIMRSSDPKRQYRQMLMYGCFFAKEMLMVVDHHILMVVDHHIKGATKQDVKDALIRVEDIVKAKIK